MAIDNTKIKKIGILAICAIGFLIAYKLLFPHPNLNTCLLNEERKGGSRQYVYAYCSVQNYEIADIFRSRKSIQIAEDATTNIVVAGNPTGPLTSPVAVNGYDSLIGDYPLKIIEPKYSELHSARLKTDMSLFESRLAVSSNVEAFDHFIFGSACMAHNCMNEQAAWVIDRTNGHLAAIILQTEVARDLPQTASDDGERPKFRIYGFDGREIPEPLKNWALELGMSDDNSYFLE